MCFTVCRKASSLVYISHKFLISRERESYFYILKKFRNAFVRTPKASSSPIFFHPSSFYLGDSMETILERYESYSYAERQLLTADSESQVC